MADPSQQQDNISAAPWSCATCSEDYAGNDGGTGPHSLGGRDWCIECIRRWFEGALVDEQAFPATVNDRDGARIVLQIQDFADALNDPDFVARYAERERMNSVHPPAARLFC